MNFGYVNFGYDLRFGYDLVTKVRNLVTFWLRCLEFGYDLVTQYFGYDFGYDLVTIWFPQVPLSSTEFPQFL